MPAPGQPGGYEQAAGCWFDEPAPGDRLSWAIPLAHGTYNGVDLGSLDTGEEDDRALLFEAWHPQFAGAFEGGGDVVVDGESVNPRLHVAMHQVVANQLLAEDPPETWQTVRRLAGLGYDWHTIMHMIASLVIEDIRWALQEHRQPDPAVYIGRLNGLPGDWPPPGPAR
ncbi:MAG TPA: DUF1841 family protein [Trebonia sp.]|nr:DUF1841 family protein [Trebonia sp.]